MVDRVVLLRLRILVAGWRYGGMKRSLMGEQGGMGEHETYSQMG